MHVYNVALGVAGTWHEVTVPRGLANFIIRPRGNNLISIRRRGTTNVVSALQDTPLAVLARNLREETVYEISCPEAADAIAEIVVW